MDEQRTEESMEEESQMEENTAPSSKKGFPTSIVLVLLLIIAAGAYFYFSGGSFSNIGGQLFGETVATVNGEKINRPEFDRRVEQLAAFYKSQGIDTASQGGTQGQLEQQVLEAMISESLLLQYAKNKVFPLVRKMCRTQ